MNPVSRFSILKTLIVATTLLSSTFAVAQISEAPQSSGPIIVNRPVEKINAPVNPPVKKPTQKKSGGTSSGGSVGGGGGGNALPATSSTSLPPRISDEDSLADGEEIVHSVKRGNDAMERVNKRDGYCELCEIQKQQSAGRENDVVSKFKAKEANTEGEKMPPVQDANNSIGVRSTMCGSRDGGYDVCIYNGDVSPGQIKITSGTPGGKSREWQFNFENKARQDLGFSITDVSAGGRQTNDTYMMLFPRKFLPSIRISGGQQIVTLPTGETVTYDAATKKIVSGVISEQKTYSGNGLSIRADQTGNNEGRFGKGSNGSATITKQNKTCQVPKKDLWPDQTASSALHFKFPTDEQFNEYLQKKCGFGI